MIWQDWTKIFKFFVKEKFGLSDEVLKKLAKEQKKDAMKNILCEVISELPSEKK